MSTDQDSNSVQSSCSEDEKPSKLHSMPSAIDADADESDNGNNKNFKKSRRLQKTRKSSNSSLQQKYENHNRKDDQQHLSSNDDEIQESKILNSNNERRKKSDCLIKITTNDDDTRKQYHRYHLLDNLELKLKVTSTNKSNSSSSIPTVTTSVNQSSGRKANRFQVRSIRKSQQQQILLANAIAAKSSNDDDCSVPNGKVNLQLKPAIIERKYRNIPTTDVENLMSNINNIPNGAISALNTVGNGHHRVRFHAALNGKPESAFDEEKLSNQTTNTLTLPIPVPMPLIASAQGEDDEEEEAVAKSPDNRFIKYAKEIGRGAFKTVYRGLDTEQSVAVAWCELQDFAQFDKQERARFKEEAEMLKKLQHPNIVRFYDFWEETNPRTNKKVIILVTELMTSGSLKGYIRKFKGQTEEKRINVMKKWCRQILKGLAYLHSRNPPVIHRDLKCDNVFISSTTGCVKIGDLGLATFKTQTFAKSMRGTMEFMAPEMFDEKYDELVDIYSFGLCMLEMITGEYPYIECKGPTAVIKRVTAGLKPDCYYKVENEDVREVVDCCIRTKKEERLPVNELLQHSFFLDDNNGLRIDFVRDPANDLQAMVTNNSIDLKLKIVDKSKRKALWTEHEAIRFRYDFTTDTPEQIVDELIEKKYIFDEDKKFVVQSIKDRLRAYQYEQIDRKAGVFCQGGKPTIHQPSIIGQQQQQILPPQQQQIAMPTLVQPQVAPVRPLTPTPPSVTQQSTIEVPQQQIVKPPSENLQAKSSGATEPISIAQLPELSSSVSGSAGSLEILDAALKKTFNKSITSLGTSITSVITNDTNEPPTSLINQDDSSILTLGNDTAVTDQQQIEESSGLTTSDSMTNINIFQSSAPSTLQTQSQPTTMLTSHQQQLLQNPLLLTQTSQSFSSALTSSSQYLINTTAPNDTIKQVIPSSSTTETIENSHTQTNDTIQSSIPSDIPSTPQPSIPGSLKQLDALLKNTFKNSNKSSGTAHNSDTETASTGIPLVSIAINDEISLKTMEIESDLISKAEEIKQKLTARNPFVSSIVHSQPNSSSIILSKTIQQVKSQPTSQISTYFDPFITPERNIHQLETFIKTPQSNDDTIVASSSNDLSEIKLMVMDLSKTLLNRMNVMENKIDEHRNQTIQINDLLTKTVLPSLLDLADIIHQTPNLDARVRTKLENIQTNIRLTQQTETKDLMDI